MNRIGASLCCLIAASPAIGQSFVGLGFLSGDTNSKAAAISSDGLSVAGNDQPGPFGQARACWWWRTGTGLVELGGTSTNITGISANGLAIVGFQFVGPGNLPAFRWTDSTGVQSIPGLFRFTGAGPGISGDGLVVVGSSSSTGSSAVRWTMATGSVVLPDPPRGPFVLAQNTTSTATNFNGSVVVGGASVQPMTGQSFGVPTRWTVTSGMQILTLSGGDYIHGVALDVSSNGGVILVAGATTVFRWEDTTGLLAVPGMTAGNPRLSGDGNTIVSLDKVWNISTGTQDLTTLLASAGCNFSGWSGLIATGVDFDGNTLCGYGTDPAGLTEAWYATVPSPTSALPLLALPLLSRRRRANSRPAL